MLISTRETLGNNNPGQEFPRQGTQVIKAISSLFVLNIYILISKPFKKIQPTPPTPGSKKSMRETEKEPHYAFPRPLRAIFCAGTQSGWEKSSKQADEKANSSFSGILFYSGGAPPMG